MSEVRGVVPPTPNTNKRNIKMGLSLIQRSTEQLEQDANRSSQPGSSSQEGRTSDRKRKNDTKDAQTPSHADALASKDKEAADNDVRKGTDDGGDAIAKVFDPERGNDGLGSQELETDVVLNKGEPGEVAETPSKR